MTEPSSTFLCPITHELMVDPVIDPDGNSYERRAVEDWLEQNQTSPITRVPLSSADLRPNRALQAAIEEYRRSLQRTGPLPSSAQAVGGCDLKVEGHYSDGFVHISILPPVNESRSPCDICCVVDTSGSMSVQAEIQNEKNEKFGLSQLDLVKHALKTIIHSLQDQDRLSLVSFANSATVWFQLTKMDADGKSSALAALNRLEDNGQTNLWDGLRAGLEVLAKGQRAVGSNSALFLLTDGCPNVEPPRGHLPTLAKLKQTSGFTCSINTFGFGYDMDSPLLEQISILGNAGSYAFIPDGSFVGTIFVNAITTLLTTVASNVQVHVAGQRIEPCDDTRWYSSRLTDQGTTIDLGSVTYGQSKDVLIPLSASLLPTCELSVTFDTVQTKNNTLPIRINDNLQADDLRAFEQQQWRLRFVHCVRTVFELKLRKDPSAEDKERLHAALDRMKALEEELSQSQGEQDAFARDLLADLTGQVREATSNDEWFTKWGRHFFPSLIRAHLLQYCNNFKDPGVQHYGQGTLFSAVRDEMDTIFCSLPAPRPAQSGAQIDMSVFHNASGGCFHGSCPVMMMDGTIQLIRDIRPGDRVAPHGGIVKYVVKTRCRQATATMVRLDGGLLITAWHPILLHQRWTMPCSLVSAPIEVPCDFMFNFALDRGHTLLVSGIPCVTLGHGFREDVVRHSYYGSERVLLDLQRLDNKQNKGGIIEISEDAVVRNKQSSLVSGLQPLQGEQREALRVQ